MRRQDITRVLEELIAEAKDLDPTAVSDQVFSQWQRDSASVLSSALPTSLRYLARFQSVQFGYVQDERDPRRHVDTSSEGLEEAINVLKDFKRLTESRRFYMLRTWERLCAAGRIAKFKISTSSALKTIGAVLLTAVAGILIFIGSKYAEQILWPEDSTPSVHVSAEWTGDHIRIGNLKESAAFGKLDSQQYYEGVEVVVLLKITNTDEVPVSIEGLKWYWAGDDQHVSWGNSKIFLDVKSSQLQKYPIKLGPGDQHRVVAKIPMPVTDSLASVLQRLYPNSTYPSLTTALQIAPKFMVLKSRNDSVLLAVLLGDSAKYFPEVLQQWDYPTDKTRRGDRVIDLLVRFSSGEKLHKTLDYIDINRSIDDW